MYMGKKKRAEHAAEAGRGTGKPPKKKSARSLPSDKDTGPEPQAERGTAAMVESLERLPDPQVRYRQATEELERHQQAIERLSSVRADAAAQAYDSGDSVRSLARRLGVSPSRVHQLIQEARARSAGDPGAAVP